MVQRVSSAAVVVEGETAGAIGTGLLLLCGIHGSDGPAELKWMADKVVNLRIFEDEEGKMNLSVLDVGGGVLAVSQFTLYGDCRRGRRPSFTEAAPPEQADRLYKDFVSLLKERVEHVEQGVFQAHMDVSLINDGPVTILLDSAVR
ncbi:MAG: D-aminoacyl-tRNA deacylase [Candidatus Xenobia bacterium]